MATSQTTAKATARKAAPTPKAPQNRRKATVASPVSGDAVQVAPETAAEISEKLAELLAVPTEGPALLPDWKSSDGSSFSDPVAAQVTLDGFLNGIGPWVTLYREREDATLILAMSLNTLKKMTLRPDGKPDRAGATDAWKVGVMSQVKAKVAALKEDAGLRMTEEEWKKLLQAVEGQRGKLQLNLRSVIEDVVREDNGLAAKTVVVAPAIPAVGDTPAVPEKKATVAEIAKTIVDDPRKVVALPDVLKTAVEKRYAEQTAWDGEKAGQRLPGFEVVPDYAGPKARKKGDGSNRTASDNDLKKAVEVIGVFFAQKDRVAKDEVARIAHVVATFASDAILGAPEKKATAKNVRGAQARATLKLAGALLTRTADADDGETDHGKEIVADYRYVEDEK